MEPGLEGVRLRTPGTVGTGLLDESGVPIGLATRLGARVLPLLLAITAPRSLPAGSASRLLNRTPFNRKERKDRKERQADESALWFGTITSSFLCVLCVLCG